MSEPKENNWKTPATVIGIVGALATVIGLFINYQKNQTDKDIEIRKLELQAETDRIRQQREDEVIEKKEALRKEGLDSYDNRLAKIDEEIEHCREQVGGAQMQAAAIVRKNMNRSPENFEDAQPYINQSNHYTARWQELEKEKAQVEKQRADYIQGVQ